VHQGAPTVGAAPAVRAVTDTARTVPAAPSVSLSSEGLAPRSVTVLDRTGMPGGVPSGSWPLGPADSSRPLSVLERGGVAGEDPERSSSRAEPRVLLCVVAAHPRCTGGPHPLALWFVARERMGEAAPVRPRPPP